MGNLAGAKLTNQMVCSDKNFERPSGQVHLVITALDYKQTSNPLTCTKDGRNMERLAEACEVADVQVMYDEQCTKDNVKNLIASVGAQCGPDDYFIFYYSGHGTSMKDQSGDEADGKDEAFCFVTEDGQINYNSCLVDDDFAQCICDSVPEPTQIVILTDCCHSGTIADLEVEVWGDRKAISITGCLDGQTSGDMGKGGIFTHSMLMAIDHLMRSGQVDYSVGTLFNATLSEDKRIFNSAQDITIQCTKSVGPDGMGWPLMPRQAYKAPLSQAAEAAAVPADAEVEGGGGDLLPAGGSTLQQNAELCEALGISPAVLQYVTDTAVNTLPENYQNLITPMLPSCFSLVTVLVQKICA
mmetsp:Transcript_14308/g.32510  ORF Transcript_14308/g.32510 Transcript_14308/m.32510 type:complete len:356 (-) Transcript_14308:66-1133(-)